MALTGPAGALEAALTLPEVDPARSGPLPLAVLCHPHPQYGGSMHDGVLGALEQALLAGGVASLRFNFRGVGASAGQFDNGIGEQEDLLAVLGACQEPGALSAALPTGATNLLLCGYSFGAAMAWQTQLQAPTALSAVWLIAPPLSMMPFATGAIDCPLHLVVGDQDDFCAVDTAQQWLSSLPQPGELHVLPGADHFFRAQYAALQELIAG